MRFIVLKLDYAARLLESTYHSGDGDVEGDEFDVGVNADDGEGGINVKSQSSKKRGRSLAQ